MEKREQIHMKNTLNHIYLQDLYLYIFEFLDIDNYISLLNTKDKDLIEVVEYFICKNYQKTFLISYSIFPKNKASPYFLLNSLQNASSKNIIKLYDSFIYGIGILN